ncbi:hypothetical protein P154DRAFT_526329 [Amniculicola lignicola CBS 123094]|uniref:Nudix hydrolase domain-containing protein n=1 Tax=Amniculicola lignicola CBS 123094 TaxID=1392246 RepID=A0A6A5WCQ1_9PLEO|nr:hypothetical protein P154DRAFT_526329 [Amniculicola lignicola CBS 123094]
MTPKPNLPFEYDPSLEEYMVNEKDFLASNPQHNTLVIGAVVFNGEGKQLLVQRAADEQAFPNAWEIPGGKVDDTDETIIHAAVRELKEETGLEAKRIVRKVGEFGWNDVHRRTGKPRIWHKVIFEIEPKDLNIVLDPVEHQHYLWATEEEVTNDKVGDVALAYIPNPENKAIKLDAFKLKREAVAATA